MIVTAAPLAIALILLHAPGGVAVTIAPHQITSLRDPPKDRGIHFPPEANCLIGLTDGKNLPVVETCEKVRELIAREDEE